MKVNLINENFQDNYLFNLLKARGVQDIQKFIKPDETCLNDWRSLDNIIDGIKLLQEVLATGEKILLIVDCDVDGFTSSAIIYQYIKSFAPNQEIDYWLHEHKQHGLEDHITNILNCDTHYSLVILPDSSSNDYEYHEQLKEIGTKCLILDHHDIEANTKISDNACIINNQLSKDYPNKDLTGAGVTWQFCRGYDEIAGLSYSKNLIDLAALGVCGDMGSVLNLENRYIMLTGFNHVTDYFFLSAIRKQVYSITGKMIAPDKEIMEALTPIKVAFYIVPMMNAMIRIGTMEEKERLFQAMIDGHSLVSCNKRGAKGTMEEVAIESLRECTNAKAKQNRITDQMVGELEQKIFKYDLLENKILFVRLEDENDYPSEVNGSTTWPSNIFSVYQRGILYI